MLVKNLVLFAIGVSECQTVTPESTSVFEGLFEIDFDGAESAEDKGAADRDRRLEEERAALIEREAAEGSNSDGRSRMGGFRGGPFRGFGSEGQFSSRGPFGPGGRLGGFGSSPPSAPSPGLEPKPSEPEEGDEPEPSTTLDPTTLTKAEPTTAPNSLFQELKNQPAPTTKATTTARAFWQKKNKNKSQNNGMPNPFERNRTRFIDAITRTMGIAPRNTSPKQNRCLVCHDAENPAACLASGEVRICTKHESCQTAIRWEQQGKQTRINSSCKQDNACRVQLSQNNKCNKLKGKKSKANRTCWRCCKGDLCNIADMAPENFA